MQQKLYIVPDGGLANRMRAIASGVSLAKKAGRHPVVIWHKDKGLNACFSDIFQTEDIPFELRETGDLKYKLVFEHPRKANLFMPSLTGLFDGRVRICQDVNKDSFLNDEEIEDIAIESGRDIIIQSGLIFHNIDRGSMNSIFRYNETVSSRMKEINKGERPRVALQIRRTDNANSIAFSPLDAFDRVAAEELKEDGGMKIFVASDDENVKRYFLEKYPENVIVNPARATRASRNGIIDAAAELYIMSECERIYGSYWSSYSEIASLIGGNTLIVVKR